MQNNECQAGTEVQQSNPADVTTSSSHNAKPLVARSLNQSTDFDLKNYLHFYIGGTCRNVETGEEMELTPNVYMQILNGQLNAKPVLFDFFNLPLSFWEELKILKDGQEGCFLSNYNTLFFIIKSGYDVFGLISKDLAFLKPDTHFAKKLNSQNPKPEWHSHVHNNFCQFADKWKISKIEEIKNYRLNDSK